MVENTFSAHSVRAASTSKANANLVPVDNILKVAGWSNAETLLGFIKSLLRLLNQVTKKQS